MYNQFNAVQYNNIAMTCLPSENKKLIKSLGQKRNGIRQQSFLSNIHSSNSAFKINYCYQHWYKHKSQYYPDAPQNKMHKTKAGPHTASICMKYEFTNISVTYIHITWEQLVMCGKYFCPTQIQNQPASFPTEAMEETFNTGRRITKHYNDYNA